MSNERDWNVEQQAVLGLQAPCVASVIGPPGSGKTALSVSLAMRLVRENPDQRIAVLSPDRRAAADVRNKISRELGYLPGSVQIQSITAFAFTIVSAYAQFVGRREPELLSGPDQDVLLKEYFDLIVAGQVPGRLPRWTDDDDGARLPAYRAEFRDLLTRAAELELSAADLAALGKRYSEPVWVSGAQLLTGYEKALATQAGAGHQNADQVDHARLITQAANQLRIWSDAPETGAGAFDIEKPQWDWVIVDDVQNATLALRSLLREVLRDGASIVTFGDPDVAVQGFRGGIAHLPALLTRDVNAGGIGAARLHLTERYRGGGEIGAIARKITGGIHTAGVGAHRFGEFADDPDNGTSHAKATKKSGDFGDPSDKKQRDQSSTTVTARAFANMDEEIAYIATEFRRLHLLEGIAYSDMAVLSRSTSTHSAIRRSLVRYGIPVETIVQGQPLREQRAVAALIELLEIALAEPAEVDADRVDSLLTGVLIGIEPLQLRRLKRELRGWELAAGGSRSNADLLVDLIEGGEVSAKVPEFKRVADILDGIRRTVKGGGLGEEVLWRAWQGVGVADQWRAQALAGGMAGDVADEDLDAVISLFRIAQRQADRDPTSADIYELLDVLESQDVPEDSIARVGAASDEVALGTPSSSIGRSWHYVAVVGINDSIWPNTRLRNPLTKVPKLVNIVVGSAMAGREVEPTQVVRDVIDDELRMLLQAVTRAKTALWLTCQQSETERPSRFMTWLVPDLDVASTAAVTLDADGLVGELRQAIASEDEALTAVAIDKLADLAGAGVRQADKDLWVDGLSVSSDASVIEGDSTMSPSRIESLLSCPLRAFLDTIGARATDDTMALDMGTLIHSLAEAFPTGPASAVIEAFEERVNELEVSDDFSGRLDFKRARKMAQKLGAWLEKGSSDVIVEQFASADVYDEDRDIRIHTRARLDRIEKVGSRVRIVDFKTGKSDVRKVDAEEHPQLRVYQWLVNRGAVDGGDLPRGTQSAGAALVLVGTGNKSATVRTQSPLDDDQMVETEDMIKQVDVAQRGPQFAAIPSDACRWCAYRDSCPAVGTGRIFS